MTAEETIRTIRMLLDDSRDWFFSLAEINQTVNDVQLRFIHEAYTKEDERLLRPLYRYNIFSYGEKVLSTDNEKLLYPKACRLTPLPLIWDNKMITQQARYVKPRGLLYFPKRSFQREAGFPRDAVYTIMNNQSPLRPTETEYFSYIYFNGYPDTKAHLWFIVLPALFHWEPPNITGTGDNEYPLSLPLEYHLDICLAAAELLNNRDAGEMERGEIAIPQMGQRLKFDQLGSGGPGD